MQLKRIKSRLAKAAKENDPGLRGVSIASVVSEALQEIGIDPILVGGAAVAFYTDGKYTTHDVDMLAPSGKDVDDVMAGLGFVKHGKDFIHEGFNIYVEFPGEQLQPTERETIALIEKVELRIVSVEDLIVDRLCAYKFWKSAIDGVNALLMLEQGIADRERVVDRAREEDVLDALDYVENVLQTVIRKRLNPDRASELLEAYLRRR